MGDQVHALLEARRIVEQHGGTELADALDRWLFAPLTPFQRRKCHRDYYLMRALAELPDGSHWTKCVQLAAEVRRFETRIWPRIRFDAEPPARLTALEQYLFRAFRAEVRVPATAQGLQKCTSGGN